MFGLSFNGDAANSFDLGLPIAILGKGVFTFRYANAYGYYTPFQYSGSYAGVNLPFSPASSDMWVRPLTASMLFSIFKAGTVTYAYNQGASGYYLVSDLVNSQLEYAMTSGLAPLVSNGYGLAIYNAQGAEVVGTFTNTLHIDVSAKVLPPTSSVPGYLLIANINIPVTPPGAIRYFKVHGFPCSLTSGAKASGAGYFVYRLTGSVLSVYWRNTAGGAAVTPFIVENHIMSGFIYS